MIVRTWDDNPWITATKRFPRRLYGSLTDPVPLIERPQAKLVVAPTISTTFTDADTTPIQKSKVFVALRGRRGEFVRMGHGITFFLDYPQTNGHRPPALLHDLTHSISGAPKGDTIHES